MRGQKPARGRRAKAGAPAEGAPAEGDNALAVMLKSPKAGSNKTRLMPYLDSRTATGLYKCLVKDLFANIGCLESVSVHIAYSGRIRGLKGLVPAGSALFRQRGRTLGQRIHNAISYLFDIGYKKVAIIGSDSPDIPLKYIKTAFSSIGRNGVSLAIGPAIDGGYYLVAMDRPMARLFRDISWGTHRVFEETLRNARQCGIRFKVLREWHDIDRASDLKLLLDNPSTPESGRFLGALGYSNGHLQA